MRIITIVAFIFLNLELNAQDGIVKTISTPLPAEEVPQGIITGQIKTTDDKPAANVTVQIRETSKMAITDDQGWFMLRNLKEKKKNKKGGSPTNPA